MQVSYGTAGLKTLRYHLYYADGSEFVTYSTLYVSGAACAGCRTTAEVIPPCRVERFQAGIAFQGIQAEAEVGYYYATNPLKNCNNTFYNVTKPVIVIDGIDHEDKRNPAALYSEYLFYRDGSGDEQNLGTELRRAGHDVVVLNFPNVVSPYIIQGLTFYRIARRGGSDYMERNAYALVELIQRLNQQMQAAGSPEKIAVVGPSMGGQVARYALAYMESQGLNHNTRLYLSLDSPHNGATIPMSVQFFVHHFAKNVQDTQLTTALEQLESPAARELVQHHFSQGTYLLPHPDRTAFMNAIASFGNYPSQLRRIAVTNGSLSANFQRDQNSQVVLEGQQAMLLEQRGIPRSGFPGTVVRILSPIGLIGRLITTVRARLFYGPGQGQTSQVLDSFIFSKGSHASEAEGPAGSCGLDGAPGGYRKYFSEIADGNETKGGFHAFQRRNYFALRDKACFIPMLSGLGFNNLSANNCSSVVNRDLVCSGEIPFDAYYGPQIFSEEHVQLTPGNVQFMRDELLRITPKPLFANAPTAICADGSAQFSLKEECVSRPGQPATTYTWTVGTGLYLLLNGQRVQQLAGVTGPQIVYTSSGYTGITSLSVTATRTGYTISSPATQSIAVNRSAITITGPNTNQCVNSYLEYSATSYGTAGAYQWEITIDGTLFTQGSGVRFGFTPNRTGLMIVKVTAPSSCSAGLFIEQRTSIRIMNSINGYPCYYRPAGIALYPNPANDQVLITTEETTGTKQRSTISPTTFQVTLYDGRGKPVQEQTTSTGQVQLDTRALQPGLYHVRIQHGAEVINRQLSVQR